jgi:pimeloyl-ACP methyl ester carboxylesterase
MALYDAVLAKWPAPHAFLDVPTRHGETFVVASGEPAAPPLVLLHGSASNSATWMGEVAVYSRHFRVYCADLPGEPGKSSPVRFSWDGPAFAEWIADLFDGLGLTRAVLGGMSLGAWATIKYALYQPERVASAILISPSGIHPPRLSFVLRMVGYALLGDWGRQRMIRSIFNGAKMPEDVTQFMTLVDKHFRYRTGAPPLFTDAELASLHLPVLFLAGAHDVLLDTPQTAARLQRLAPDLTVCIVGEDGHAVVSNALPVLAFLVGETAVPA